MLTSECSTLRLLSMQKFGPSGRTSKVDPRGIAFVLNYPESVTGLRTTPRTLVQFFEQIEDIDDLRGKLGYDCKPWLEACLTYYDGRRLHQFRKRRVDWSSQPRGYYSPFAKSSKSWEKNFKELSSGKDGREEDRPHISHLLHPSVSPHRSQGLQAKGCSLEKFLFVFCSKGHPERFADEHHARL